MKYGKELITAQQIARVNSARLVRSLVQVTHELAVAEDKLTDEYSTAVVNKRVLEQHVLARMS